MSKNPNGAIFRQAIGQEWGSKARKLEDRLRGLGHRARTEAILDQLPEDEADEDFTFFPAPDRDSVEFAGLEAWDDVRYPGINDDDYDDWWYDVDPDIIDQNPCSDIEMEGWPS